MAPDKEIPLYTKIGSKVTTIILLLLMALIVKNCVNSVIYGTSTDQKAIEHYYNLGYQAGARQASTAVETSEPRIDNPLLQKTYHKGYRDGWDAKLPTRGKNVE